MQFIRTDEYLVIKSSGRRPSLTLWASLIIFEFSFKENAVEGLITFYFNKDGYTTCKASNKNKKVECEILDLLAKDSSTYAKFEDLQPFVLTVAKNGNNIEDITIFLQKISKHYNKTQNGYKFTSKYGESIFIVNYKDNFVIDRAGVQKLAEQS